MKYWIVAASLGLALILVWFTQRNDDLVKTASSELSRSHAHVLSDGFLQGGAAGSTERVALLDEGRGSAADEGTRARAASIQGHVVDTSGRPMEARIFVGAEISPFVHEEEAHDGPKGVLKGRYFESDPWGHFQVEVPSSKPVTVCALPAYSDVAAMMARMDAVDSSSCVSILPPTENLLLELPKRPSCRIQVSVVDQETGERLSPFRVEYRPLEPNGPTGVMTAEKGVLRMDLPVDPDGGLQEFMFTLIRPNLGLGRAASQAVVSLGQGQLREIVFGYDPKLRLRGQVVSTSGDPVSMALVSLGQAADGRSDGLFGPFKPHLVYGVHSDRNGLVEVSGDGEFVTAFHPKYCTTRVPARDNFLVELLPRGSIGIAGYPGGGRLELNGELVTPVASIDGERWILENVDQGLHLLQGDGGHHYFVRVREGRQTQLQWANSRISTKVVLESSTGTTDATRFALAWSVDGEARIAQNVTFTGGTAVASLQEGVVYRWITDTGFYAEGRYDGSEQMALTGRLDQTTCRPGAAGRYAVLPHCWIGDSVAEQVVRYLTFRLEEDEALTVFGDYRQFDAWLWTDGRWTSTAVHFQERELVSED